MASGTLTAVTEARARVGGRGEGEGRGEGGLTAKINVIRVTAGSQVTTDLEHLLDGLRRRSLQLRSTSGRSLALEPRDARLAASHGRDETMAQYQKSPQFVTACLLSDTRTIENGFAFAMQCISTIAVVRRETGGWKWPAVQFAYMGLMAYAGAFIAFHLLS